jgi:DNA-binding NarL/FixJ family response regulator
VLSGGVYLPALALDDDLGLDPGPAPITQTFARLSPRQREVARLLLQGQSNKVIGRELGVSEGTIKAHVSAIYQIIGAKNRVEAVTLAAKSGIAIM